MTTRTAIVGAGLAGLTAANHLADGGADVTVLERAREPGGRATTTRHGSYRFNQGPHAMYVGGEAHATLVRLGVEPAGHAPVQGNAQALAGGELHTLPVGGRSLLTTDLIGAREKLRFGSLLARIARVDPDQHNGITVREWATSVTSDPAAIELLLAITRLGTYANAPDMASAGPAVRQLQRAVDGGVLYLDGGWGRLVGRLVDRATAAGVTFTQRQVTSAGPLLDEYDAVVLAVGSPSVTDELLGSSHFAAQAGPPVEAAVLELGVTAVPPVRFILGIDEPVYASVHAPPADLAPDGHSVICLARYLSPAERHDADDTRRQLTALAERMGVKASDVAEKRYLHRMTVANGLPLASRQGLAGRPAVDGAEDPRIAIAGDWVGSTGLLADASIASGLDAARHLLRAGVAA